MRREAQELKRLFLGAKVLNLTPHAIVYVDSEGKEYQIPPSGIVARLKPQTEEIGLVKISEDVTLPLIAVSYGDVIFLDSEGKQIDLTRGDEEGYLVLIVPQLVAPKAKELAEMFSPSLVIAPNTNDAIRDDSGRIKGVKSFILLAEG